MKKINVAISIVLVVVSAFLLWLWFHLGFNKVDSPLDLVLSILWWVVVIAGIALTASAEKRRQRAVRTVYVCAGGMFNPEAGVVEGDASAASVAELISGLEYGFSKAEVPADLKASCTKVVRSEVFMDGGRDWRGEVVDAATGRTASFASMDELAVLIA